MSSLWELWLGAWEWTTTHGFQQPRQDDVALACLVVGVVIVVPYALARRPDWLDPVPTTIAAVTGTLCLSLFWAPIACGLLLAPAVAPVALLWWGAYRLGEARLRREEVPPTVAAAQAEVEEWFRQ